MEFYTTESNFLEELLSLRNSENTPLSINEYNFDNNFTPSFQDYSLPFDELPNTQFGVHELSSPLELTEDNLYNFSMVADEEHHRIIFNNGVCVPNNMDMEVPCKMEPMVTSAESVVVPSFNMGVKNKTKKISGQPSKNLMAERRRRKRLNDRLSMLRSVVPKISKMDRTSILGDTIDYMKELLERINNLQEEMNLQGGSNQLSLMSIFKDVKPNEVLMRNSPKFDVERREIDTRIEICCGGKPGMLVSTVTTLEALGLEIQQCVISCFNDFSMQASCSQNGEESGSISSEDIKQALFRNAGYGGRCV